MIRNLSLSFLLATLLISCKQEAKPVTPEEAQEFARKLESSVDRRDPDFFNEAIDKKYFLKKAGLGSDADSRRFGSGVVKGLKIGNTIIESMSKKGNYDLVRQYQKNGVQHLILRLYDDGSLNYHDIELKRTGKEVKVADIFIYYSGEFFSETIKGLWEQLKATEDDDDGKLKLSWAKHLVEMKNLTNQGKPEEALAVYDKLPREAQRMRAIQIMHVMIVSALEDPERSIAAIKEYKSLYPNEPNMHLLLLDGYFKNKEYDKALEGVNELDKMINKDPFLDYFRYLIYNTMEDHTNARASLVQLMKNMPDFEEGTLELIAMYIKEDQATEADRWIEKYRMTSAYDQQALNNYLDMAGYQPGK
jgi:hypothetical protein